MLDVTANSDIDQLVPARPGRPGAASCVPLNGDRRALRDVLGRFATGITVLTSAAGDRVHGMTANSFSSVSLDPPLVLVCVQRGAVMLDTIANNRTFAVSILGADQERVARHFASRDRPSGISQFDPVDWQPAPVIGAPLLAGAVAWLECELESVHDGGDHLIFVGRVLGLGVGDRADALLFFGGTYRQMLSTILQESR